MPQPRTGRLPHDAVAAVEHHRAIATGADISQLTTVTEPHEPHQHADQLGGELNAAVARSVVRIYRNVTGHGPTRAQAFFRNSVVVVVMEHVMTKAELSLTADGRRDDVRHGREALQAVMRPKLIAAVEDLTGAEVRALLSSMQPEPDLAAEVFVLDRQVTREASPT